MHYFIMLIFRPPATKQSESAANAYSSQGPASVMAHEVGHKTR
jgi:hypothetical protein